MIVIATGISGSGKMTESDGAPGVLTEFLAEAPDLIAAYTRAGEWTSPVERFRVRDMGARMLSLAQDLGLSVRTETILDMDPEALQQLRAAVFTEIVGDETLFDSATCTLIASHACFWWKGHLIAGLDPHYLKLIADEVRRRQPAPDAGPLLEGLRLPPPTRPEGFLYVTVVDSIYQIHRRLEATDQWRGQMTPGELLAWQEQEVFLTKTLAQYERVPHYLIAHDEPTKTLFDLLCFKRPRVYLGYPITNLRRQGLAGLIQRARAFGEQLRGHFVVFDPLSVKDEEAASFAGIGEVDARFSPEQLEEIRRWAGSLESLQAFGALLDARTRLNLGRATVIRDLRLIDQSDMNVVFYPTSEMSAGVLSEMIHAHTTGKEVYVIYPFASISPFLEYNATRVVHPGPDEEEPARDDPEAVEAFMARASEELLQDLTRQSGRG